MRLHVLSCRTLVFWLYIYISCNLIPCIVYAWVQSATYSRVSTSEHPDACCSRVVHTLYTTAVALIDGCAHIECGTKPGVHTQASVLYTARSGALALRAVRGIHHRGGSAAYATPVDIPSRLLVIYYIQQLRPAYTIMVAPPDALLFVYQSILEAIRKLPFH